MQGRKAWASAAFTTSRVNEHAFKHVASIHVRQCLQLKKRKYLLDNAGNTSMFTEDVIVEEVRRWECQVALLVRSHAASQDGKAAAFLTSKDHGGFTRT